MLKVEENLNSVDYERQLAKERLVKVLKDRLNLVNMFERYLNEHHKLLTAEGLGIMLNQREITKWLKENNKRINELSNYFKKHGSHWQKYRCQV